MHKLNRREFLRVSTLATAATLAGACAGPAAITEPAAAPAVQPTSAPATQPTPTRPAVSMPATAVPAPTKEVSRYNEAPQLAELVARGELPPVEERLPLNPCVCPVLEQTGTYGGTIRRGFSGVSDGNGPAKMLTNFLIFYTHELALRPDMAESWEVSPDAKVYTVHLREGMKWHDGSPFTSADLQWWWEMRQLNKELTPALGRNWYTGEARTPMVQTAPDDYTVVYEFADPNPLFVYILAMSGVWEPSEYARQWHTETAEDKAKIESEIAERGLTTWVDLYTDMLSWRTNPEVPQISCWYATNTLAEELHICERNPYYWQVDEDGNQLPYCDRLTHRLFESIEVFNMWILNGEIDYQGRHVDLSNYTLFREGEEKGGYRVHTANNDATQIVCINQTVKNPQLREFFQNANCRKAMSLAIDREEIVELIYDGLTKPRQYSPSEASPQFYSKLSNAYIEYDPDTANAMLDAEGYTERDAEGFRMHKDGSGPVTFILEDNSSTAADEMEMIARYLADVGIKMLVKIFERSLVEEHCQANDIDARFTLASRAALPLVDPNFFVGFAGDKSWGYAWTIWYNDPTNPNAEEPPDGGMAKSMWEIWNRLKIEPDTTKHTEMFFEILDVHYEYLPYIGISGEQPALIIMKKDLRNLPFDYHMPWSNPIQHDGFIPLQTFYWEA